MDRLFHVTNSREDFCSITVSDKITLIYEPIMLRMKTQEGLFESIQAAPDRYFEPLKDLRIACLNLLHQGIDLFIKR